MNNYRCLAIHDIAGLGKCSLTVALPILSAGGIETTILPTSVFSNHTAFPKFLKRDLTEDMLPFAQLWQDLGAEFEGIYSGFLGSVEQIDLVSKIFDIFKTKDNVIVVDPVMGDGGKLYKTYTKEMADGMIRLCQKADVIIPNITEACYMTGLEYREAPHSPEFIEGIIARLKALGCKSIVLTGVGFKENELGVACYDNNISKIHCYMNERFAGSYHGTGDVFGSVLTAGILRGKELKEAVSLAANFTVSAIKATYEAGTNPLFGVKFESVLGELIENFK